MNENLMKQIGFAFSVQGSDHIKKEILSKEEGKNLLYPCQDRSFFGTFEPLESDTEKEILLNLRNGDNLSYSSLSQKKLSVSLKKHSDSFKIICVSDGHGSAPYFRSEQGAEFAITSLVELVSANIEKFHECYKKNDFATIEKGLSVGIAQNRWLQKLSTHFIKNPISEAEYEKLNFEDENCVKKYRDEEKQFRELIKSSDEDSIKKFWLKSCLKEIYGCTLIAYIEFDDFWYALQIGDGDLAISYDGEAYSKPIPEDENCNGNVTTSLCGENSYDDFRFAHGEKIPQIILCSSDGMANSVKGDEGLFSLYKWYVERFYNCEFEKCQKCQKYKEKEADSILKCDLDCRFTEAFRSIEKSLFDSSERGSGDDFSLAAIIRLNFDDSKRNCVKKSTYYRYWENELNKSTEENSWKYLHQTAELGNPNANLVIGDMLLKDYESRIKKQNNDDESKKIKEKARLYLTKAGKKGEESLKKLKLLYIDFVYNQFLKTKIFNKTEFIQITEELKILGESERIKKIYTELKNQIIAKSKNDTLSNDQKDGFRMCLKYFGDSDESKELFFACVDYYKQTGDDFLDIYNNIIKKYH